MTQATLFDHPARSTDPVTSHDAARPGPDRTTLTATVRSILEAHPDGLTDNEVWLKTGLSHARFGSVVKRRQECGAIDSGRKGLSQSGRPCIVWVLPGDAS